MTHKIDRRFSDTVYLVCATTYEIHSIWEKFAADSPWKSKFNRRPAVSWKQFHGVNLHVGDIGNHSIRCSFTWNMIDGRMVCFWDAISQVIDYKIVDKWIEDNLAGIPRSNPANFIHVLGKIEDLNSGKLSKTAVWAWTEYPLDKRNPPNTISHVELIVFDENKYVIVRLNDVFYSMKRGYLSSNSNADYIKFPISNEEFSKIPHSIKLYLSMKGVVSA